MFDWEDLRAYLAAVEGGSFAAAAHKLSVDPATIGRRTARLESALHATLLVRSPGGLHPTATGARVFEEGRRAEAAMLAAHQAAQPDLMGGVVRLSVSEAFGTVILAPALPAFRKARPGIRIELAASAGFLSPSRYEVDLAVTLSAPDNPRLHVEPLAEYGLGLFASHSYLADHAAPAKVEDLHDHDIVGYVDDLIYTPELRYLDEVRQASRPRSAVRPSAPSRPSSRRAAALASSHASWPRT